MGSTFDLGFTLDFEFFIFVIDFVVKFKAQLRSLLSKPAATYRQQAASRRQTSRATTPDQPANPPRIRSRTLNPANRVATTPDQPANPPQIRSRNLNPTNRVATTPNQPTDPPRIVLTMPNQPTAPSRTVPAARSHRVARLSSIVWIW
uniref:Uncharacterized protein n=1 Tax=Caenorhabditis japonica TaxID=281687 RepID=A0A8R1E7N4_CAEJA